MITDELKGRLDFNQEGEIKKLLEKIKIALNIPMSKAYDNQRLLTIKERAEIKTANNAVDKISEFLFD